MQDYFCVFFKKKKTDFSKIPIQLLENSCVPKEILNVDDAVARPGNKGAVGVLCRDSSGN